MKLSQIHQQLNERREKAGDAPAAVSTVSTWLRSLASKGLLIERVLGTSHSAGEPSAYVRTRGMIPTSRSPHTGYEVAHPPGAVLGKTFKALADAYPPGQRAQAIVDFAHALDLSSRERSEAVVQLAVAMGLPERAVNKLERLLEERPKP